MVPILDDLKEMWNSLPSWFRMMAVVAAAVGMMMIAGSHRGNAVTAITWILAFLVLFLLPGERAEKDER
ncbi:MAG: hypothetical protein R6U89_07650 [Dehalococcoidia bacterium]